MSTKMQVEWRRNKAFELLSKGNSQSEIAKVLQVDLSIISRDVYYLRQQAKSNIKKYVNETLPEEYEKCLLGLTSILKEAWNTSQNAENKTEKIQALSLAKECYSMKLDLLTNATVVGNAMRFVSDYNKKKSVSREEDKSSSTSQESKDSDYEDKGKLEEKQKEETEQLTSRGKITTTTNQFF